MHGKSQVLELNNENGNTVYTKNTYFYQLEKYFWNFFEQIGQSLLTIEKVWLYDVYRYII